ncbi:RagB/SusD family nutrient uptake outer membrane protein [Aquimarina muelleri]|uniref:Glycan metabolism protein RagB n=1 Tax=Aquimarina muelleri TaxID=279356 RepID=A0A918JYA1_9FLAO|nr:RagB/SusD family nutrient uptake outer membrane protein [Aquimarina muelleri]MCX2764675.1 RagB/SusD family nutrient uptake outer membrane protein [Aquimarina muelleri]GGX33033.1 glycan metabolism protein RagB [Aquimarina muelleri]
MREVYKYIKTRRIQNLVYISVILITAFQSCQKELEIPLQGQYSTDVITYDANWVSAQLTAAYGMLDGNLDADDMWRAAASNWVYGEVASDNAYKGSEFGDQPIINNIERYAANANESRYYGYKWNAVFEGVARSNETIRGVRKGLEREEITTSESIQLEAEARFLRAHYHFEAKKMWGNIPYIDETVTTSQSNVGVDSWGAIETDFIFAVDNLKESSRFVGAANSWVAKAYLAKIYMYQLDYAEAKPLLDDIINSGPFSLTPKYSDNFNAETNNSVESIFAVQNTVGDGSAGDDNANWGDALNFPNGAPVGTSPTGSSCCGFFQPSQNLVNAYKTDASGLPLLETFNDVDVVNDDGIDSNDNFTPYTGELDPRLDWKVGRRGIDFNGWGIMPGQSWIRNQPNGGPYLQKVTLFRKSQFENGSIDAGLAWAPGVSSMNTNIIRFAEILLWRAEIMAAEGEGDLGVSLVDRVRIRAANPDDFVQELDINGKPTGNPAANYMINTYGNFANQDQAIKAVAHEYRIETALEGHRFFDLVRREVAAKVLSAYLNVEVTKRSHLNSASFIAGKSEHYPIPQTVISVSNGKIKQNKGY